MIEAHFLLVYFWMGIGPFEGNRKEKMPKKDFPIEVFSGLIVNNNKTVISFDVALSVMSFL